MKGNIQGMVLGLKLSLHILSRKCVCVCVCMEGFRVVNVCGIVGEITNIKKITKIGWNFIVS